LSPTYVGFLLAAVVVPLLPRRIVRTGATLAGLIGWAASRGARRAVRENLRVVLGREPLGREIRSVFVTQASNYGDLVWLPRLKPGDVQDRVQVEGLEHLTSVLANGRGAIVASLHLGNIEVIGYAARNAGFSVMLPVERVDPPELLDLMIRLRRRAGLVCEPVGHDAFDRIRVALRENSIVGIGVDRITLGDGDVVNFCGRPTRVPIAAALLSLRTGAPLVPVGCTRLPGDQYRVRIGPPLTVDRTGSLRGDVRRLTERLLSELQRFLEENPTQWVIFRPMWDSRPASPGAR
jgi:lauroyl/myristoyl acyltransferase